jgi:hypothetical protein
MSASKYWKLKNQAAGIIASGGTRQEAAKACGVDPSTVFRWLKKPDFQKTIKETRLNQEAPEPEEEPEPQPVYKDQTVLTEQKSRDKRIRELNPSWPSDWITKDPRKILYAEIQSESDPELRKRWAEWLRATVARS